MRDNLDEEVRSLIKSKRISKTFRALPSGGVECAFTRSRHGLFVGIMLAVFAYTEIREDFFEQDNVQEILWFTAMFLMFLWLMFVVTRVFVEPGRLVIERKWLFIRMAKTYETQDGEFFIEKQKCLTGHEYRVLSKGAGTLPLPKMRGMYEAGAVKELLEKAIATNDMSQRSIVPDGTPASS